MLGATSKSDIGFAGASGAGVRGSAVGNDRPPGPGGVGRDGPAPDRKSSGAGPGPGVGTARPPAARVSVAMRGREATVRVVVIDMDATLITAHSDKQGAAAAFKKGYGRHPLGAWCANTAECLAMLLRPGNAGSNTVSDHTAPRGALSYPQRSWKELEGRFLGPMAHLDLKSEGNRSMPENHRSCSGA